MTEQERKKLLRRPEGVADVILDTDAYNELDDQFAIAYMLQCGEKINCTGISAAPFFNERSCSPENGMERSYAEILKLLKLCRREELAEKVFRGAKSFMRDEHTPVDSPAAREIVRQAKRHSKEKPLYVAAIAAITNVASAVLIDPSIKEKIVLVWLGGHARNFENTREFNMYQDENASKVILNSGVPFVQLPCQGVVSAFTLNADEMQERLAGKNSVCDYLAVNSIEVAGLWDKGKPWVRVIWDVSVIAWFMNEDDRFMEARIEKTPGLTADGRYDFQENGEDMLYVYRLNREPLMNDMLGKLYLYE